MTDAPTQAPRTRRPAPPPRSRIAPAVVAGFVVLTYWAGSERFGIGFSIGEIIDNVRRASRIVSEFLDPDWSFIGRTIAPFIETLQMAIIAAVIGCGTALIVGFLSSRVTAPGTGVYVAGRAWLNVIRAMPDLLYALVFVAAFSIGPLAGILALIFFNIGVVAKLTSETIDGVDPGPLEAARAAGARHVAAVRTAVLPQVLPNYLAYSLYTFELNLRASTVIGIVGAGGIGQLLEVVRVRFEYGRVAVIIVEIFIIVFIVEAVSIAVRRRLV